MPPARQLLASTPAICEQLRAFARSVMCAFTTFAATNPVVSAQRKASDSPSGAHLTQLLPTYRRTPSFAPVSNGTKNVSNSILVAPRERLPPSHLFENVPANGETV